MRRPIQFGITVAVAIGMVGAVGGLANATSSDKSASITCGGSNFPFVAYHSAANTDVLWSAKPYPHNKEYQVTEYEANVHVNNQDNKYQHGVYIVGFDSKSPLKSFSSGCE